MEKHHLKYRQTNRSESVYDLVFNLQSYFSVKRMFFILLLSITTITCREENTDYTNAKTNIQARFISSVDADSLLFDTILYTNAAGNIFSVSKLEYFVSELVFHNTKGDIRIESCNLIKADDSHLSTFPLSGLAYGDYLGVTLYIGLDSMHNTSGGLASSIENNSMFWPITLGGGYHFLKLEGHFVDSSSVSGYAIHLGKNENLIKLEIHEKFSLSNSKQTIEFNMNVNEWFVHPIVYDLHKDGRFTMGSQQLMNAIASNGNDVFTIKILP